MFIYFRHDEDTREEFEVCKEILPTSDRLTQIPAGERVVCRYSALPFYREVEAEIASLGSRMIHSYDDHCYIANMHWVDDLGDLTFPTYHSWANLPETEHGYVVKGRTNSRKFEWNRRMFAKTTADIQRIANSLLDDYMIAQQGLVVREYIPLRKFDEGINGLPITNEWRLFFLDGKYLGGAYYWSTFEPTDFDPLWVPTEAKEIAVAALAKTPLDSAFVVIDVAEDQTGRWWVVELNDGQMSGLSYNTPQQIYSSLALSGPSGSRQ